MWPVTASFWNSKIDCQNIMLAGGDKDRFYETSVRQPFMLHSRDLF